MCQLTWVRHAPLETRDIFRARNFLSQDGCTHHRTPLKSSIEFPLYRNVDNAGEVYQAHLVGYINISCFGNRTLQL